MDGLIPEVGYFYLQYAWVRSRYARKYARVHYAVCLSKLQVRYPTLTEESPAYHSSAALFTCTDECTENAPHFHSLTV